MRCCASPTTSTVPEPSLREASAQFAALLYRQAFAPLAAPLGFFGETVVDSVCRALARNERGGLAGRLEQLLEAARR
ncbi:MAG: hypothetical protein WCE83_01630 [Candidatus Baltobacteraceae bacterium]